MACKIIKNSQFTLKCDNFLSADGQRSSGLNKAQYPTLSFTVANGVASGMPVNTTGLDAASIKAYGKVLLTLAKAMNGEDVEDCEC